jgi:hypothetical protein
MPPVAWVRHPRHLPGHVYADVNDAYRPGVVSIVGGAEVASGAFVGVVVTQ